MRTTTATTNTPEADDLALVQLVSIASPCPASWDEMEGDDRTRHCAQCNLDVHDLSQMTAAEVLSLVRDADGRVCGQLHRRADGRVLTRDCPVGLRVKMRRRLVSTAGRIVAGVTLLLLAMGFVRERADANDAMLARADYDAGYRTLTRWIRPAQVAPMGQRLLGRICVVPGPPPPPLTAEQVSGMTKAEAYRALEAVAKARKHFPELKRLKSEFDLLMRQLRDARR